MNTIHKPVDHDIAYNKDNINGIPFFHLLWGTPCYPDSPPIPCSNKNALGASHRSLLSKAIR